MSKHFLFDERFQSSRENVQTVIAPCVRHASNPLTIDGKCENNTYFSIWREPGAEGFRGIFNAGGYTDGKLMNLGSYLGMRSPDGLTWRSHGESLFTAAAAVMRDDGDADAHRRYKAIFTAYALVAGLPNTLSEFGVFSAVSPDGAAWNDFHPVVMCHREPGFQFWRPGTPYWTGGDNNPCLLYAPTLKKYVALYRTNIERGPGKRRERAVGRSESADFRTWSSHELVFRNDPDAPDSLGRGKHDIHGVQVWPVGEVYLGIIEPYYWTKEDDRMHMELVWSPDTVHWKRICPGQDFVPHPPAGAPDGGCRFPACRPVEVGDEVRVYYGSSNRAFLDRSRASRTLSLFLATFKRDRFAGAAAGGPAAGRIVTHPLALGSGLTVNADASNGSLRAELQSESGRPVPSFTFAESVPVTDDALDARLAWHGCAALPAGSFRIAFELKNTTLYAVTSDTLRRLA